MFLKYNRTKYAIERLAYTEESIEDIWVAAITYNHIEFIEYCIKIEHSPAPDRMRTLLLQCYRHTMRKSTLQFLNVFKKHIEFNSKSTDLELIKLAAMLGLREFFELNAITKYIKSLRVRDIKTYTLLSNDWGFIEWFGQRFPAQRVIFKDIEFSIEHIELDALRKLPLDSNNTMLTDLHIMCRNGGYFEGIKLTYEIDTNNIIKRYVDTLIAFIDNPVALKYFLEQGFRKHINAQRPFACGTSNRKCMEILKEYGLLKGRLATRSLLLAWRDKRYDDIQWLIDNNKTFPTYDNPELKAYIEELKKLRKQ